ncbi:MAG TPA: hypothetical protein VF911_11715 [Thermoanaerobaculia bacterium]|jgi:hypothetical protein
MNYGMLLFYMLCADVNTTTLPPALSEPTVDWTLWIAVAGLTLGLLTSVRQFWYFKGTEIRVIESDQMHRMVPLEYRHLSRRERETFTRYIEARPGFALFRIPWWNSGDRGGFIHLVSVKVSSPDVSDLKCAYYAYHDVQPEHVNAQSILVRNLPLDQAATLRIEFEYRWVTAKWLRLRPRAYSASAVLHAKLDPILAR